MKKVYSLTVNGSEVVSVEMDVPDFLPRAPKLDRTWLMGIVTEQVAKAARPKGKTRNTRPGKLVPSAGV